MAISSLNARVMYVASTVLASFFGLAGLTLDRAYQVSAESALHERLQGQIYALIAAATIDGSGRVYIPEVLPQARFSMVGFDLYAQLSDYGNHVIWHSPSLEGLKLQFRTGLSRNEQYFSRSRAADGREFTTCSIGVAWDDSDDFKIYTFSAAESREIIERQINRFRQNLWGWLGGVALLLVIVQGAIMRWGLAPLNKITEELAAIKAGQQTRLKFSYPGELKGLTDNVNALLSHQQEHLERYRHTLADLAHSLKTPLAVLRAAVEDDEKGKNLRETVQTQIDRMTQITDHQLGRAAAAGQTPLVAPVAIREIVKKVVGSLRKVYADKGVECRIEIPKDAVFHGDEGDLMEVIGNITDNAFKWCKKRVRVTANLSKNLELEKETLDILVEDDGPGISHEMVKRVVERGVRADQAISGHGIGLSVVQDIVTIYGGQLKIAESNLGGAAIGFSLPDVS